MNKHPDQQNTDRETKTLNIKRRQIRERPQTTLSRDLRNNIGQLTPNLIELNVL